jgi:type I restriction enzyme, S subunit
MSAPRVRVGDVLRLMRRQVQPEPDGDYGLIGVYSWGKGIFHRDPKKGADLGDYRFFAVEPGDLVLSNIQAWEGAIAWASNEDYGAIGTHRFLTYVPADDRIDTDWARWFFLSEPGMALIRQAAPGTTMRNRTLAIERFENLRIPLPPLEDQQRTAAALVASTRAIAALAERRDARDARVDALMPSLRDHVLRHGTDEVRSLGDVAVVEMGQSPPGGTYNDQGRGLPLLNGPTEFGPHSPRPVQWTEATTKVAEPGDLLLCVRGATTGRMNWADQRYCIGRGLAAIRPSTRDVTSAYLRHALLCLAPEIMSRTAGSTFANLPGKRLVGLPIPVPDRATQDRRVAILDDAERAIGSVRELRHQSDAIAKALRPALLRDAFAGLN